MIFSKELINTTFKKISIGVIAFSIISSSFFFFYLIPHINQILVDERKETLHHMSEFMLNSLQKLDDRKNNGTLDENVAHTIAIETINNFRYGNENDDYFWAAQIQDGKMIAHPYTNLHGDDLSTYTDPEGYNFGKRMFDVLEEDDPTNNYVSYKWISKSHSDQFVPKLSYISHFEPWGWLIGTGMYMNDVENEVATITQKLVSLFIFILLLMIILLTYIIKAGSDIEKQRNIIHLEFQSLIQNLPVGVFKTRFNKETKKDTPIVWNNALINLLEIPNEKNILKNNIHFKNVLNKSDQKTVIKRLLTGEDIPGEEYEIKTFKGNSKWIKLFAQSENKDDGIYVDASIEDINEKRIARKKLGETYDKLRDIEKTKNEVISITSHELRTPLTIIKGFTSILANDEFHNLTNHQKEQLLQIEKNSDNLLEMITNMLDMEKLENGKMQLNKEKLNMTEFLTEIQNDFKHRCKNEDKKLTLKLPHSSIICSTDRKQLKRIFTNLIDNAIKFTKTHEGKIEIFAKKIDSDKIEIHIKDNGIGIAKSDIDTIFNMFIQIDNHIERVRSGSGLGLPISYKLARKLGHDISVDSTIDKGSDFYVTLNFNK